MACPSSAPAAAPAAAGAADAFSALSLSTNEHEHPCWGCARRAPPLDEQPFERCSACVRAKYPVCARFCGIECQMELWQRHK
jgi:hypothetical protein